MAFIGNDGGDSAATGALLDPFFIDLSDPDRFRYPINSSPYLTVVSSISAGEDRDFFRITLGVGDRLIVDIDNQDSEPNSLDSYIEVFNPDGSFAGFADDVPSADTGSADTFDALLDFTATVAGTHSFSIAAFNNGSTGSWEARIVVVSASRNLAGGNGADRRTGGFANDTLLGFAAGGSDTASDTLLGLGGDDRIESSGGNDSLDGGTGSDLLLGGVGDDVIDGGNQGDTLRGGAGDDRLRGDGNAPLIVGTQPDASDRLLGGAGNDTVEGGRGGDTLAGGEGNDSLYESDSITAFGFADGSRDILEGNGGNDTLSGGDNDLLFGGTGNDRLVVNLNSLVSVTVFADGGEGSDTLAIDFAGLPSGLNVAFTTNGSVALGGGATVTWRNMEQASFTGSSSADQLSGGAGRDTLGGGAGGGDLLEGNDGNDVLDGGGDFAADTLLGGTGDDQLTVAAGGVLDGGDGNDTLDGGGSVVVFGGAGDDRVRLGLGNHFADGDAGIDVLVVDWSGLGAGQNVRAEDFGDGGGRIAGGAGLAVDWDGFERVEITAGGGSDTLNGTAGGDLLIGGGGRDLLSGSDGADTLEGGAGADDLTGGRQNDVFRIRSGQGNGERILDFIGNRTSAGDAIEFVGYGPGAMLTAGAGANQWNIIGSGATETITVTGVLVASDYTFV